MVPFFSLTPFGPLFPPVAAADFGLSVLAVSGAAYQRLPGVVAVACPSLKEWSDQRNVPISDEKLRGMLKQRFPRAEEKKRRDHVYERKRQQTSG